MTKTAELTEKQIQHRERRNQLKALSKVAKLAITMGTEERSVNEILIGMYTDAENKEFHTLHQWSAKGFKVKKGSKSFLVWGKPKDHQKAEADQAPTDEDDDKFFPLCYLFSNAQVEPREK